jgi:hypothetical protein
MGPTRVVSKDGRADLTFRPNRGAPAEVALGDGFTPNPSYFSANPFEEVEGSDQTARYAPDDVVQLVRIKRLEQGKPPDSSFLMMRGVYTGKLDGAIVTEDSVQVLIVDLWNTSPAKFLAEMKDLTEYLGTQLRQELVILEMQRSGVLQKQYLRWR